MASKVSESKISGDDLGSIYEQHKDRIFRLGLRMFKNVDDAKDLVNDTFMQVIKKYTEFRGDSAVSTWVHEIAVHEALQKIRKRGGRSKWGKRREVDLDEVFAELIAVPPDQEAALIRNDLKERINQAFQALGQDCQTILFLWLHEELSGSALAEALDISVQESYRKKETCLAHLKAMAGQTASKPWRKNT